MIPPRFRRSRPLLLAGALLLALLLCEIAFALIAARYRADPEGVRDRALARGVRGVEAIFRDIELRATDLAERLAARIREEGLLEAEGGPDRIGLFRTLAATKLPKEISGVLVRGPDGVPVAWEGKTYGPDPDAPLRRRAAIVKSRIYRVLYAEVPVIREGRPLGSVVAAYPFDLNFPLNNRYLRSGDFEDAVTSRLGLQDIDITPGEAALERARRNPYRRGTRIVNLLGETMVTVNVEVYPLGAVLATLAHRRDQVRAVLLAAFLLLFTFVAGRAALRPGAHPLLVLLFALVALLARIGIYLAGFPALLLSGEAFDPAQFSFQAFDLDLGLFQSPGDLVVTGLFLLAVTGTALRVLGGRPAPRLSGRAGLRAALGGLLLFLASLAAVPAAMLAFAALLHAVTFYSTVEFFSDLTVLPALPAALVLVGMFLLVTCLFTATAALLRAGFGRLPGLGGRRRLLAVPAGAAAGYVSARLVGDLGILPAATAALGLAGCAWLLSAWERLGRGVRYAALTGIVTAATFLPFTTSVWREVRADVEEEAEELFLPLKESPLLQRLESDLLEIASSERLVSRLTEDPERVRPPLAFRLWAAGPLARRARGSDLTILDRTRKKVISRFEIDMPPHRWLPDPLPGASADEVTVWDLPGREGGARQRFLVGCAPIRSEAGEFLGQVVVRMPLEQPGFGGTPRPEILRSYEEGAGSREVRTLHYSEYEGDRLVRTTNPDYPQVHRAPPDVVDAIFVKRLPRYWTREEIAGVHWINLYRPRLRDGRVVGLESVGFRSKELRSLLLSFFKLLVVNSAAALLITLVLVLPGVRRRRPRFQSKLLATYVVISAVPVLLLAQANRSIARETVESQMNEALRQGIRLVRGELRDRGILAPLAEVARPGVTEEEIHAILSDEKLKESGYRLGHEINVFLEEFGRSWGALLVATSEPGIFATELFSDRLSGRAYLETMLLGRQFFTNRERIGEYSFLVGYTPIRNASGKVVGAISIPMLYAQDAVDRELAKRNSLILALYLLILLVVVFIGMLLARRISSPIERLAEGTRRLSAGDLDYRIPSRSRDEFGDLVESFNRMTEDLRRSRERIVRAEKDAAWREMAKQVAHEIKNPLTPMRLSAQHILRAFRDRHEDFEEILSRGLDTIIRQTEALSRIAGEFSAFARLPVRRLGPVDAAALVREVAELYAGAENIEVVEEIEEVPPVRADRDELRRVLVNLAANAVEAMEEGGGVLTFRVRSAPAAEKETEREAGSAEPRVEISVSDTGIGIPEEDLDRLFLPSFSTKTGGTGLGLAISKTVVESFGGGIAVSSFPGKGTTVTVRLLPA